jgi:hypothetical protein
MPTTCEKCGKLLLSYIINPVPDYCRCDEEGRFRSLESELATYKDDCAKNHVKWSFHKEKIKGLESELSAARETIKKVVNAIDSQAYHWKRFNYNEPNYRDVMEVLWGLRLEVDEKTPYQKDWEEELGDGE